MIKRILLMLAIAPYPLYGLCPLLQEKINLSRRIILKTSGLEPLQAERKDSDFKISSKDDLLFATENQDGSVRIIRFKKSRELADDNIRIRMIKKLHSIFKKEEITIEIPDEEYLIHHQKVETTYFARLIHAAGFQLTKKDVVYFNPAVPKDGYYVRARFRLKDKQ